MGVVRLKAREEDLAIWGGQPAFAEPLHVGRPNIGDRARLMDRIAGLLDRRWLTNRGPLVQEFEERVADYLGVRHCVATCNATVGLEVTAAALGLGGSVIVPSFTFIASAHALKRQGLDPIFCDVNPDTHLIDPEQVEALVRPDTSAILGVHLWGRGCDVDALRTVADRHGLHLMFDAAHAFGCSHEGRMIGGFGEAEVFSFHATKAINSFEGGAIATNNDALAERARLMINFGFADYDQVVALGTNGKMSEPCAAMGLTSLESRDAIFAHNRANYRRYAEGLASITGLSLVRYDSREASNYHYLVVEVDRDRFGLSRDELQHVLVAENVHARRYFTPGCHRSEPYRSLPAYAGLSLPATERLSERVLCLPTGTAAGVAEIDQICRIIALAGSASPAMLSHLGR